MLLEEQVRAVQEVYPQSIAKPLGNGVLLEVAPIRLNGWSKPLASVWINVPVGYPVAKPDCFWADSDLRLATGVVPKSAVVNQMPDGQTGLWFSWHATKWNPNRDTLLTYVRLVEKRLAQCE